MPRIKEYLEELQSQPPTDAKKPADEPEAVEASPVEPPAEAEAGTGETGAGRPEATAPAKPEGPPKADVRTLPPEPEEAVVEPAPKPAPKKKAKKPEPTDDESVAAGMATFREETDQAHAGQVKDIESQITSAENYLYSVPYLTPEGKEESQTKIDKLKEDLSRANADREAALKQHEEEIQQQIADRKESLRAQKKAAAKERADFKRREERATTRLSEAEEREKEAKARAKQEQASLSDALSFEEYLQAAPYTTPEKREESEAKVKDLKERLRVAPPGPEAPPPPPKPRESYSMSRAVIIGDPNAGKPDAEGLAGMVAGVTTIDTDNRWALFRSAEAHVLRGTPLDPLLRAEIVEAFGEFALWDNEMWAEKEAEYRSLVEHNDTDLQIPQLLYKLEADRKRFSKEVREKVSLAAQYEGRRVPKEKLEATGRVGPGLSAERAYEIIKQHAKDAGWDNFKFFMAQSERRSVDINAFIQNVYLGDKSADEYIRERALYNIDLANPQPPDPQWAEQQAAKDAELVHPPSWYLRKLQQANILGTDAMQDPQVAKMFEPGGLIAQAVIRTNSDEMVSYVKAYDDRLRGFEDTVTDLTRDFTELYRKTHNKQELSDADEKQVLAQVFRYIGASRTLGLISHPFFIDESGKPAKERSMWSVVFGGRVEVVGLNNKGKVILRDENSLMYLADLIDRIESASIGIFDEIADAHADGELPTKLKTWGPLPVLRPDAGYALAKGAVTGDIDVWGGAKTGMSERRNVLEFAIDRTEGLPGTTRALMIGLAGVATLKNPFDLITTPIYGFRALKSIGKVGTAGSRHLLDLAGMTDTMESLLAKLPKDEADKLADMLENRATLRNSYSDALEQGDFARAEKLADEVVGLELDMNTLNPRLMDAVNRKDAEIAGVRIATNKNGEAIVATPDILKGAPDIHRNLYGLHPAVRKALLNKRGGKAKGGGKFAGVKDRDLYDIGAQIRILRAAFGNEETIAAATVARESALVRANVLAKKWEELGVLDDEAKLLLERITSDTSMRELLSAPKSWEAFWKTQVKQLPSMRKNFDTARDAGTPAREQAYKAIGKVKSDASDAETVFDALAPLAAMAVSGRMRSDAERMIATQLRRHGGKLPETPPPEIVGEVGQVARYGKLSEYGQVLAKRLEDFGFEPDKAETFARLADARAVVCVRNGRDPDIPSWYERTFADIKHGDEGHEVDGVLLMQPGDDILPSRADEPEGWTKIETSVPGNPNAWLREAVRHPGRGPQPEGYFKLTYDEVARYLRKHGTEKEKKVLFYLSKHVDTRNLAIHVVEDVDVAKQNEFFMSVFGTVVDELESGRIGGALRGSRVPKELLSVLPTHRSGDLLLNATGGAWASPRIFLHELAHAATMQALAAPRTKEGRQAVKTLEGLYETAKKELPEATYGLTNLDEFVAEAFSSADFQDMLRQLPARRAQGRVKAMWDEFVEAVADVLGVAQKDRNALAEAIDATDRLLRAEDATGTAKRADLIDHRRRMKEQEAEIGDDILPSRASVVQDLAAADPEDFVAGVRRILNALPEDAEEAREALEAGWDELTGSRVRYTPGYAGKALAWIDPETGKLVRGDGWKGFEKYQAEALGELDELVRTGGLAPAQAEAMRHLWGNPKALEALFRVDSDTDAVHLNKAVSEYAASRAVDAVASATKAARKLGIKGVRVADVLSGKAFEKGGPFDGIIDADVRSARRSSEAARRNHADGQAVLDKAGVDFKVPFPVPTRAMLVRQALEDYDTALWKAARDGTEMPPRPNLDALGKPKAKPPQKGEGFDTFGAGTAKRYDTETAGPTSDLTLDELYEDVFEGSADLARPKDLPKKDTSVPAGERDPYWYEDDLPRGRSAILGEVRKTRDKLGRAWKTDSGVVTIPDHEYEVIKTFVSMVGTNRLADVALAIRPKVSEGLLMFDEPLGLYMFADSIVGISHSAIVSGRFVDTTVHELWHSLSRFLPDATVADLHKQFVRERETFMRANPKAFDREGALASISMAEGQATYRYANFDEWVVEKMKDLSIEEATRKASLKMKAAGEITFGSRADQALRALRALVMGHFNQIKAIFGRDVARKTYMDFMKGKHTEKVRDGTLASAVKLSPEQEAASAQRWQAFLNSIEAGADAKAAGRRMTLETEKFLDDLVTGVAKAGDEAILPSRADDEAIEVKKGKLQADQGRLIELLGASMYDQDIVAVSIKELVQNAFDGVKSNPAPPPEGNRIIVTEDSKTHTIEIEDNGIGMTADTVQDALFTIGGTDKSALKPGQRSGGLGLAKMAFLFGGEEITVRTVKNGIRTEVQATPLQIKGNDFEIRQYRTDEPNGTSVKVKFPEQRMNPKTGELEDVDFGGNSYGLAGKIIGDVEVVYRSNKWGDSMDEQVIETGKHIKLPPVLTKVKFSWGEATIYMGTKRKEYTWANVYSAGLRQFQKRFDDVPFEVHIDIRPDVPSEHPHYPFNNQREGWRGTVKDDVEAIVQYLQKHSSGLSAEETANKFADAVTMEKLSLTELGGDYESSRKAMLDKFAPVTKDIDKQKVDDLFEYLEVAKDGSVTTDTGRQVVKSTKERKSERAAARSMKAEKAAKDARDYFNTVGVDTTKPIFHSNLNTDILAEVAKASRTSPHEMMAEFGSAVHEFMRYVAEHGGPVYRRFDDPATPYAAGISLDKGYRGVHVRAPYNAFFLNPLAFDASTPVGAGGSYLHTLFHEAAHTARMSHDEMFTVALGNLYEKASDAGGVRALEDALIQIASKHWDTLQELKRAYENHNVKNRGRSLEDSGSRSAYVRGEEGPGAPRVEGPHDDGAQRGVEAGVPAGDRKGGVTLGDVALANADVLPPQVLQSSGDGPKYAGRPKLPDMPEFKKFREQVLVGLSEHDDLVLEWSKAEGAKAVDELRDTVKGIDDAVQALAWHPKLVADLKVLEKAKGALHYNETNAVENAGDLPWRTVNQNLFELVDGKPGRWDVLKSEDGKWYPYGTATETNVSSMHKLSNKGYATPQAAMRDHSLLPAYQKYGMVDAHYTNAINASRKRVDEADHFGTLGSDLESSLFMGSYRSSETDKSQNLSELLGAVARRSREINMSLGSFDTRALDFDTVRLLDDAAEFNYMSGELRDLTRGLGGRYPELVEKVNRLLVKMPEGTVEVFEGLPKVRSAYAGRGDARDLVERIVEAYSGNMEPREVAFATRKFVDRYEEVRDIELEDFIPVAKAAGMNQDQAVDAFGRIEHMFGSRHGGSTLARGPSSATFGAYGIESLGLIPATTDAAKLSELKKSRGVVAEGSLVVALHRAAQYEDPARRKALKALAVHLEDASMLEQPMLQVRGSKWGDHVNHITKTKGVGGHYDPRGHEVVLPLRSGHLSGDVLFHEAAHAVTSRLIYAAQQFQRMPPYVLKQNAEAKRLVAAHKDLNDTLHKARMAFEKDFPDAEKMFYALADVEEFIAEIFSNQRFRMWLSTVPAPGKRQTLLSKVAETLKRMFKVEGTDAIGSLLDESLGVIDDLIYGSRLDEAMAGKGRTRDVLLQSADDAADAAPTPKNLVVTHGTDLDGLKMMLESGKVPAPSLGVSRIEHPAGRSFGDITLLARSDMVDPAKGSETFSSDAWTPRAVDAVRNLPVKTVLDEDAAKAAGLDLDVLRRINEADGFANEHHMPIELTRGWPHLLGEADDSDAISKTVNKMPEVLQDVITSNQDILNNMDLLIAAGEAAALSQALDRAEAILENTLRSYSDAGVSASPANIRSAANTAIESVRVRPAFVSTHSSSFSAGLRDRVAARSTLNSALRMRTQELKSQGVVKDIGPTPEDIAEFMKEMPHRGGEMGSTTEEVIDSLSEYGGSGMSSLRAAGAERFDDLDAIKGARDRLRVSGKKPEFYNETKRRLAELNAKAESNVKGVLARYYVMRSALLEGGKVPKDAGPLQVYVDAARSIRGFMDDPAIRKNAESFLMDRAIADRLDASLDTGILAENYANIKDELIEFAEFLQKGGVSDYFEAKPFRPVALSEFEAAVIPYHLRDDLSVKELEKFGIKVHVHGGPSPEEWDLMGTGLNFGHIDRLRMWAQVPLAKEMPAGFWGHIQRDYIARNLSEETAFVMDRVSAKLFPSRVHTGRATFDELNDGQLAMLQQYIATLPRGKTRKQAIDAASRERDILFQEGARAVDQTQTPEFKNFFGDWEADPANASKVVDEQGRPRVVHHGGMGDFDVFTDTTDIGFHFGTAKAASNFAGDQGSVMPVYLNIRNPAELPDLGGWNARAVLLHAAKRYPRHAAEFRRIAETVPKYEGYNQEFQELAVHTLQEAGFDGVVYINKVEGEDKGSISYAVFESTQVKSATGNVGTFDPKSGSILKQPPTPQGLPKGAVEFLEDSRAVITLFQKADVSTLVHELSHIMRRDLDEMDNKIVATWAKSELNKHAALGEKATPAMKALLKHLPDEPDEVKKLLDAVELDHASGRYVVKEGADVNATAARKAADAMEEVFARGFERYVREGWAPNAIIAGVFRKLKQWMTQVYEAVKGSPIEIDISPEVRDVMDRMIHGPRRQRTEEIPTGLHGPATQFKEVLPITPGMKGRQRSIVDSMWQRLEHEVKPGKAAHPWLQGAAKATLFTYIGDDAMRDLRFLGPDYRREVLRGERIVHEGLGDLSRLLLEDDGTGFKIVRYLGGAKDLTYGGGRAVKTDGVDYAGNLLYYLRQNFEALDPSVRASINVLVKQAKWNPNVLTDDEMTAVHRAMRAFFSRRASVEEAPSGSKTMEYTPAFGLDVLTALGKELISEGDVAPELQELFIDFYRASGAASESDEVMTGVEASLYLYDALARSAKYGTGTIDTRTRARVLLVVGAHGLGIEARKTWMGAGIYFPEELALAYKSLINSEIPLNSKMTEAAAETMRQIGVDAHLTADDLIKIDGKAMYMPAAARQRLYKATNRAMQDLDPLTKGLRGEDAARKGAGPARALNSYYLRKNTRGAVFPKPQHILMQSFDTFWQMSHIFGWRTGTAAAARVALIPILSSHGVSQALMALEAAARLGAKYNMIEPKRAHVIENLRAVISEGGDKVSDAINQFFYGSIYNTNTNKLLRGADEQVEGTNLTYRELRQIMVEEGIFSSFDATLIVKGISRMGLKHADNMLKRFGKRVYGGIDELQRTTSDFAEGFAERERVGAALTLIAQGYDPRVSCRSTVVMALHDYGSNAQRWDRHPVVKFFFPYWNYNKNINTMNINSFINMRYYSRMRTIHRLNDRIPEALTMLQYQYSGVSPLGFIPENMTPEEKQVHDHILGMLRDKYQVEYAEGKFWDGLIPNDAIEWAKSVLLRNTVRTSGGQLVTAGDLGIGGDMPQAIEAMFAAPVGGKPLDFTGSYVPAPSARHPSAYGIDQPGFPVVPSFRDPRARAYFQAMPEGDRYPYVYIPEAGIIGSTRHIFGWFMSKLVLGTSLAEASFDTFTDVAFEQDSPHQWNPDIPQWRGWGNEYPLALQRWHNAALEVVDPLSAPLYSDAVAQFGAEAGFPTRLHPWIAEEYQRSLGVKFLTTPAEAGDNWDVIAQEILMPFGHATRDAFAGGGGYRGRRELIMRDPVVYEVSAGQMHGAKAHYNGEVIRAPGYWMPPGMWSMYFNMSPLSEVNRLMLAMEQAKTFAAREGYKNKLLAIAAQQGVRVRETEAPAFAVTPTAERESRDLPKGGR